MFYRQNASAPINDPAFVTTHACGVVTPHREVLCLNSQLQLDDDDQLRLLAYSAAAVTAVVRTPLAEAIVRQTLGQMPDHLSNTLFKELDLASCSFACERVIVLEK